MYLLIKGMKTKQLLFITLAALAFSCASCRPSNPDPDGPTPKPNPDEGKEFPEGIYNSYEGLVMAGYQGWFNTPTDGANRGWTHYGRSGVFKPGTCSIDMWPDMSEYMNKYETPFKYADGSTAYLYSAYDAQTVDVHFKWMKQYGIDGVFMQRFLVDINAASGMNHANTVLKNAMKSALKYKRAICMMYDLTLMPQGTDDLLLSDIDNIAAAYNLFDHEQNPSYLYHNGKPLVAVWGVGFTGGEGGDRYRPYTIETCDKIISGLIAKGYSVMVGVPTYWRERKIDAITSSALHTVIRKCDIVAPWFVGRYNPKTYSPKYTELIERDMNWCQAYNLDYAPLAFPGFSWSNMYYPEDWSDSFIDRKGGVFLKQQLDFLLKAGAKMIYIAMFDEIDEGTAIYKIASEVPVGQPGSTFYARPKEDDPGLYMQICGNASKELKRKLGYKVD